ncbi:hypothetical protein KK120_18605 [Virgibacillus dakarensis]|nr:hypothetical protein [Virgibacillus dakarensis]
MSKYVENDTVVVKYKNIEGDTRTVVITPVGYFNATRGLKFIKSKIPFKQLVSEFMSGDKEKNVDIEVILDVLFELNEHLPKATKYFIKDEKFDITQVRDIEDLTEILKAVYKVNKIDEVIKNFKGSQPKKENQ